MKALPSTWFVVVGVALWSGLPAIAQTAAGALAINSRQGSQWGWAVDYETADAAREAALRECGYGCSVVLTFEGCAAYAADAAAAGTALGWGESNTSRYQAEQSALSECGLRGGSECRVVALGCNGPVSDEGLRDRVGDTASPAAEAVEAALGLDGSARRAIQRGLAVSGVDPGAPDGIFGPGTRGALRRWQASGGLAATGYLDGASALVLQAAGLQSPAAGASGAGGPAVGAVVDPRLGPAGDDVALTFVMASSVSAQLPPAIQVDRLLLMAEQQLADGDNTTAIETFDRIIAISRDGGLEIPAVFWFKDAQVSQEAGLHARAIESVTRYLTMMGQDGADYRDALTLLDHAEVDRRARTRV